jgi:hypothetical protein
MRKNMSTFKILGLIICSILAVLSLAFIIRDTTPAKKDIGKADGKGFAVLELFTSEGCSSCPPADELLAKIQQESQGKAVYFLAYHVDYWDRLGWKDIFSSADYSERQVKYGRWLNVSPIYTPQVIVNGKAQYIGSEGSAIRLAISAQLAINPGATLAFRARQDGSGLIVQYQATHAVKGCLLLIAIIQKSAQSKVARGENAGHTLSHVQIVRKLQSEPLNATGNGSSVVALPKEYNAQNWEVIGMIQDQSNGQILAVAKPELNETGNAKK